MYPELKGPGATLACGTPKVLVTNSGGIAAGLFETLNAHCWKVLVGCPRQQGRKAGTSPVKSITLTVKLHGADTLPTASVAVQVTVVNPNGKSDPLGGTQPAVAPGQLSCAVAAKVTTAPH